MKNPIRVLALAGCLFLISEAYAVNDGIYHLTMVKIDTRGNKNPDNRHGQRSKERPITGEITTSGVNISGIEISDIISFEIYDQSGTCLGIYSDEMDFVNALFSLSGEFEIVFVTNDDIYVGIVKF